MFTPGQYRAKAAEYGKLLEAADSHNERHEFQALKKSFTVLADDQQWLVDKRGTEVRSTEFRKADRAALIQEEDEILRCLGAALILQWNTLPQKLRRELFDNAGTIGELLETGALRAKIARFLHKHRNDGGAAT